MARSARKLDSTAGLRETAIAAAASVGLGGIVMEAGETAGAIRLWEDALSRNAGLELVRLNLTLALLRMGDRPFAEFHRRKAMSLNPALAPARDLLLRIHLQ